MSDAHTASCCASKSSFLVRVRVRVRVRLRLRNRLRLRLRVSVEELVPLRVEQQPAQLGA